MFCDAMRKHIVLSHTWEKEKSLRPSLNSLTLTDEAV